MLLTYRLKKTKEKNPPCPHTTAMTWRAGSLPRTPVSEGIMRLYGLCKTGSLGALSNDTLSKTLATSRKTAPVSLFSQMFQVILSKRPANCKDVLCLGRNPNCSSRISSQSLTSYKILVSRIFSNILSIVSKRLLG